MSITANPRSLGLGIGWRPQIALAIERRRDLGFVEIVAENFKADRELPDAILRLRSRGVRIVPHGLSLSLGGAERPDPARLGHLARLVRRCDAPLVSEHIAFVRSAGVEAGHLLPVPRTRAALSILVENVKIAIDAIQAPLALENISSLFEWPDAEMDEVAFIAEALQQTGALLLLDVSNVHANARNLAWEAGRFLDALPLDQLGYVHVGGGYEQNGIYHDTHAHSTPPEALNLLRELASRVPVPGAMLERDDEFPTETILNAELDAIQEAMSAGQTPAADQRESHAK